MTRLQIGRWLTWATSLAFLATAALHGSGYRSMVSLSRDLPGTLGKLVPMLWLVFSSDLVILGLIIGVVAMRPSRTARPVLALAALCPLVVAAMQLLSIGFVPPTALLIGVGVLALVSAALLRPETGPESTDEGDRPIPVRLT